MKDLQDLFGPNPSFIPNLKIDSAGALISGLLEAAFYIAGFMAFIWMVWGAFQYILAQGKKEELQKARSKITYAIIGLMVVLIAFFIMKFTAEIFPPSKGGLPF